MLYFLKKFVIAHPYQNSHLSTMATFLCHQGGYCGGGSTVIYFNKQYMYMHAKWNLTCPQQHQ